MILQKETKKVDVVSHFIIFSFFCLFKNWTSLSSINFFKFSVVEFFCVKSYHLIGKKTFKLNEKISQNIHDIVLFHAIII